MHSAWLKIIFVGLLKFLQTKEGGPNFWGELILHKIWIIWSPGLYFNFKSLMDPNFSWFIRFQSILHDSGVLLSEFWNFYKLKSGEKISGGNEFHRSLSYLVPLSVFQFWKFYRPKFFGIHYISMHSAWLRSTFLRVLKFLQIKEGGPDFWEKPILQNVWITSFRLLYFNFKSFMDPNFSLFIIFQCILLDSRVLFSKFWSF